MSTHTQVIFEEENFIDKMHEVVVPFLDKTRNSAFFELKNRKQLHYEEFIHPNEKAIIVISHGFCEFTRKYDEVIYTFYQEGYSVYVVDHLGHGYSSRDVDDLAEVHISSYDEYVASLHTFISEIVIPNNPNSKLVLFGHSMGGAISTLYLEEHPGIFSCAVLSSPMLEIAYGKNPKFIVWLLMRFMNLLNRQKEYSPGSKGFDPRPVFETSSCLSKARYDYIFNHRLSDKHFQTYSSSNGWIDASMKATKKIHKNASKVNIPILLFQAELDTMVAPKGQDRFAATSENTNLKIISDSKHEIFNALVPARINFYNELFHFLDTQL
jgi:lysophospholipase